MTHPDGTPYWTPAFTRPTHAATLTYSMSTGELFTKGGKFMGEYATLDLAAEAFLGEILNTEF